MFFLFSSDEFLAACAVGRAGERAGVVGLGSGMGMWIGSRVRVRLGLGLGMGDGVTIIGPVERILHVRLVRLHEAEWGLMRFNEA